MVNKYPPIHRQKQGAQPCPTKPMPLFWGGSIEGSQLGTTLSFWTDNAEIIDCADVADFRNEDQQVERPLIN